MLNYRNILYLNNKPLRVNNRISNLYPTAQFNSLSTVHKLSNLGLSFTNLNFLSTKYPTHNIFSMKKYNLLTGKNLYLPLPIVILKLLNLRTIHTYLVLYQIF